MGSTLLFRYFSARRPDDLVEYFTGPVHILERPADAPALPHELVDEERVGGGVRCAVGVMGARQQLRDGVAAQAGGEHLLDPDDAVDRRFRVFALATGGALGSENRMRVPLAIVDAVAGAVGSRRTAIRLSPGNLQFNMREDDPAPLYRALVAELDRRDLAYLHLTDNDDYPALADLRPRWHGTLIANIGENRKPTTAVEAEAVLRDGRADLVSFGRAFIANPDLVERITHDLPLASIREELLYGRDAAGYSDYPRWEPSAARCA
ncbi:hypothetical protein [Nocardia nepalensis]|uniref:oxidoreductase n=1 Tax=Nocardia nepalensis TaxID=3375448 RepID=UPI003B6854EF